MSYLQGMGHMSHEVQPMWWYPRHMSHMPMNPRRRRYHQYIRSVQWLDRHIVSQLDMMYTQLDLHMHTYPTDMVHMLLS